MRGTPLRSDFDALKVRAGARASTDAGQTRRLLALAEIYDGSSRTQAAMMCGVTLQIVRDWVVKFNEFGLGGLIDKKPPGQPPLLNAAHLAALAAVVESGPDPAVHGIVRWRIVDLRQWLYDQFQISVSEQTLSRVLRAMNYRRLSARPRHHAQAEGAIEDFKKVFRRVWRRSPARRLSISSTWKCRSRQHRNLVCGRGSHRSEKQDHTPMGEARNPAERAQRPTHRIRVYFWGDLREGRQGRGARHATLRHTGHEPSPGRDCDPSGAGRARRPSRRSGGMASFGGVERPAQHHTRVAAGQMPGTQPARERVAVHA